MYDCKACRDKGKRTYSHGSTWRGGVGPVGGKVDICDICWGSGDAKNPFTNIRELENKIKNQDQLNALQYLSNELGCHIPMLTKRLNTLADLCDSQSRKRKIPEGEDFYAWSSSWMTLSNLLRKIADFRK